MSRPFDHADEGLHSRRTDDVLQPRLGPVGWLRFAWRQLTSMRTALLLLLLLAIAAVPGSLFPQRTSDPNGVIQHEREDPDGFAVLDALGLFDVYASPWFSAVYLLLFVSLVGCIVPRTRHHWRALRSAPPRTPARFARLPSHRTVHAEVAPDVALDAAQAVLRSRGYRVARHGRASGGADSVAAERGYLREWGNLLFHAALVGVLVSVGVLGGFTYSGQRVLVTGGTFTNFLTSYDTFRQGRFFDPAMLRPFTITLDDFEGVYDIDRDTGMPLALDFTASVTTREADGEPRLGRIKVNEPLGVGGMIVYLLGNGFAPVVTVRDGAGEIAFSGAVPFLPQDANLTSTGVIKVPDAMPETLGFVGFFYPTEAATVTGASTSIWPDPDRPVLSLNVFTGDLGLDDGVSRNAYVLDTDPMTQVAGGDTDVDALRMVPGDTATLPNGLGTITFDRVERFATVDLYRDPTQAPVFVFAMLIVAGLMLGLFVPRRRMWVRATADGDAGTRIEYGGLARGDDPRLDAALDDLVRRHHDRMGGGDAAR